MSWVRPTNNKVFPSPKYGSGKITMSTFVDGGRNQNGNFIGQVIGDDKQKIEITFAQMTPHELAQWLSQFDRRVGGKFTQEFEVYDPVYEKFMRKLFYVGDRSMQPFKLNEFDIPERFLDIQANLIEV